MRNTFCRACSRTNEIGGGIISHYTRINREIRAANVRTIDVDGKQAGVLPLEEALRLAEGRNFDLVEVAPNADPPVCRVMDYGKFRYEQSKKEKDARKKQHSIKLKEIKFRPAIEEHDYTVKMKHLYEFLEKGFKVKVMVVFRGRELGHMEFGAVLIKRLETDVAGVGAIEMHPKRMGRTMTCVFSPARGK